MSAVTPEIKKLLSAYNEQVVELALEARKLLLTSVKGMDEQVDVPAKMLAYSFGKGYKGMLFTIIPSKKEIKIGFYKGVELPDPHKLLTGAGKVHKHVPVATVDMLKKKELKALIAEAHVAYLKRETLRK